MLRLRSVTVGSLGSVVLSEPVVDASVRQIHRYAYASSQDTSPIIGLTHASYALILLETLQAVVGKEAIAQAGQMSAEELLTKITSLQDKHARALSPCDPQIKKFLPPNSRSV